MPNQQAEKERAILLIEEMRSGEASDERQKAIVSELDKILPDPNYWDYMIDHVPEMTSEQIVEKAFIYSPIII